MRGRCTFSGLVSLALAGLAACADAGTGPGDIDPFPPAPDDTLPYVYSIPPETGDGWRTGHVADVGLDEARLTRLVDLAREGVYPNLHGLVVVKDGLLVFEEYFSGFAFEAAFGDSIAGSWTHFDRDTPHNLASVTKSVTSTLLGIAWDRGLVSSVDVAAYDFFPERDGLRTPRKDSVTLHHLLTMTSGLEWDEWTYPYGDPRNDISALFATNDPVGYILAKDGVAPPGARWAYSGGNTIVAGEVVARVSGVDLVAFADEALFAPLGIDDRRWVRLAGGTVYASGDLRLRPRDMAKIGWLYANDGQWDAQPILSPAWIDRATTRHAETVNPGWGYGYQWWLYDFVVDGEVYRSVGARGWGGQMITVFPDHDLVVVQTGGNYLTGDPADAVVRNFVLEALAATPQPAPPAAAPRRW